MLNYLKIKKAEFLKKFKIKVLKRYGLEGFFHTSLSKIGLILGIILMALTTLNLTNSVQTITINQKNHTCQNGDKCIFKEPNFTLLFTAIEDLGIKKNQKLTKLPSNKSIKNKLMLDFPQISDVSIKQNGVNVTIDILEAKLPTNEIKTNLVAPTNGIVIKTEVISGKLKVKNGDIVLKGDILIENTGTPAKGTVTLRSFVHESTIFNENQISYIKTGNKMHINNISLFGLKIKSNKKCNYKLFKTEQTHKYLSLNAILPIKLNQITYYELKKQENNITFESQKDSIYKELEEKTNKLIPLNAEIKNTSYTLKQEGSRYLITCYKELYLTLTI